MELAGQRIAVNICYEDLFGDVIRRAWHDPEQEPTMMLNLSNLAWFEDSIALAAAPADLAHAGARDAASDAAGNQHRRHRDRRREPARWSRSCRYNTAGALDGIGAGPARGLTPFIRYGNVPALVLCR